MRDMSRIQQLFNKKSERVLNIYCTAGYPHLESTIEVLKSLQEFGADMIEIGMPYSDPLADGPVIQQSSTVAIKNGMTIAKLFEQLENFRKEIHLPVVLMGYMNSVLQYGFDKFCADASRIGLDGLILPDLPQYEYESFYKIVIKKYNLDFIFLVTPETSDDRIKMLDELSSGFLYAVSSSSTTGSEKEEKPVKEYLRRLKGLGLKNPVLVGFGIKDKAAFDSISKLSSGGIIGSAYIQALGKGKEVREATKEFLGGILDGN